MTLSEPRLVEEEVSLDSADPYELHLRFAAEGWSDGLPIIPPTRERVSAMLDGIEDPQAVIGTVPPDKAAATHERVAIQAVMAGCAPAQFRVVVAAVRAVTEPPFNLTTIQATTHSAAPFILVGGPDRHEVGLNSGTGCLGPGTLANATIGRALRLVLSNIGGARPGDGDFATQGHPGKFTYCAGENEEESPWAPFHVDRGFEAGDNALTAIAAAAPIGVNNHVADSAEHVLETCADTMTSIGGNFMVRVAYGPQGETQHGEIMVALTPEHAATVANDGWTKDDVRRYLFERARIPRKRFAEAGMWTMRELPKWLVAREDENPVPVVASPEHFLITVIGGPGKHSSVIPSHGAATQSVTVQW